MIPNIRRNYDKRFMIKIINQITINCHHSKKIIASSRYRRKKLNSSKIVWTLLLVKVRYKPNGKVKGRRKIKSNLFQTPSTSEIYWRLKKAHPNPANKQIIIVRHIKLKLTSTRSIKRYTGKMMKIFIKFFKINLYIGSWLFSP